MGLLTASGSLARVAGSVVVSYVYEYFGTYPTIGIMIASLFMALCLTLLSYKRLGQLPVMTAAVVVETPEADEFKS